MLNDDDVLSEGFRPLKLVKLALFIYVLNVDPYLCSLTNQNGGTSFGKPPTANRPVMNRGMSFNAETGAKESAQDLWAGSSYEKYSKSKGKAMDRANSFVGTRSRTQSQNHEGVKEGAIVIVDPFSTGAHLAAEVCKEGYICVRVFSVWDSPVAALVQKGLDIDYSATIQHNDKLSDQDAAIQEVN